MYELENVKGISIGTMMTNTMTFVTHAWVKLGEALHYPITWITGILLFIGKALAGGKLICYVVILASVFDLICGVALSLHRKKFTVSELLRQSVEKLVVYGLALLVFLCIDRLVEAETTFTVDITAGLVGVLITLTETWSFLASLLILFPNNPFLKFMQKYLVGELARKLGCEESEVNSILNASRKKRAIKRDGKGRFVTKQQKTK